MGEAASYLDKDAAVWAQILGDRDPVVRRLAVYALGEIGAAGMGLAPALEAGLHDGVNWVRVWAAAAFGKATREHRAVDLLIAEMGAPEAFVRSLVAWHLGRLGTEYPGIERGIDALQRLLDDPDPSVRIEADLALQSLQRKGALPSGAVFL